MRRRLMGVFLASILLTTAFALAVPAGTTSSGGPWFFTRSGVTCQWSGTHTNVDGKARAITYDNNGGCGNLGQELKFWNGSAWVKTGMILTTTYPSSFAYTVSIASSAGASRHRAQNNFDLAWSGDGYPHPY